MYAFDPKIYRAAKIAYMEKRGLGCFDFKFYSAHNPDVAAAAGSLSDFWNHFVYSGQFENRQYRSVIFDDSKSPTSSKTDKTRTCCPG